MGESNYLENLPQYLVSQEKNFLKMRDDNINLANERSDLMTWLVTAQLRVCTMNSSAGILLNVWGACYVVMAYMRSSSKSHSYRFPFLFCLSLRRLSNEY